MRVEVRALKRDGGATVTLQLAVINVSDVDFSVRQKLAATSHAESDGEPCATHRPGQQGHIPGGARRGQQVCVQHRSLRHRRSIASEPVGDIPAPANEVANLTVVIPDFMPMDHVPIH